MKNSWIGLMFAVMIVLVAGCGNVTKPQASEAFERDFTLVKGGVFDMGDVMGGGEYDEKVHRAEVSDFYISKYEVTLGEFKAFINDTQYKTVSVTNGGVYDYDAQNKAWSFLTSSTWDKLSFPQTDKHPVAGVSWYDCVAYCNWRSLKEGLKPCYKDDGKQIVWDRTADGYRLLTEAEWEYAARSGGKVMKYAWGNEAIPMANGKPLANIADQQCGKMNPEWNNGMDYDDGFTFSAPVGSFPPNQLGICDMSGNVWEWCWDWYNEYPEQQDKDYAGAGYGTGRVFRGGSWYYSPQGWNVSARFGYFSPSGACNNLGFRIARSLKSQ